ncbi:MAG TPA: ferritin-like domain-containing protein, partial [Polyangiaceae bacterium]
GRMEHASIAAFARFSLQLLSLGAPPELVDSCTQALADETAHTKLCFRIASAYAGRALGPGPLDIQRSLEQSSLAQIVELVIAEGCFGETSAALDALEAAQNASDPVIAASYARIATDEQRHAELAFRFVRWALERGDESVPDAVRSAVLTPPSSHAGARQVTLPCLRALLSAQSLDLSAPVLAAS